MNNHITENTLINSQKSNQFNLEIALTFLIFASNQRAQILQNQILKQACLMYDYNTSTCNVITENGNSTKVIEDELQPYVTEINMIIALFRSIIPSFLTLFVSPWSDIYGRKKVLNVTFIGYAISLCLFAIVCYYSENIYPLSPWIYIVCYFPEILLGGWTSLINAVFCYIGESVDENYRGNRLVAVEMICSVGIVLASLSCNLLLKFSNSTFIFTLSAIFSCISASIVLICITKDSTSSSMKFCDQLKDLISTSNIIESIQICFMERHLCDRKILMCLISILMLNVFTYNTTIAYLFERGQFEWDLLEHNYYQSVNIILTLVGSIIGLWILKSTLNTSETFIIFLSLISGLCDSLLKAFTYASWQMYAISVITLLRILSSPMCRSLISIIVPQNEIGKVFGIVAFFEAISNFLASLVYTFVYNVSFRAFAGGFYFVSVGSHVIGLILCTWLMFMMRNQSGYEMIM